MESSAAFCMQYLQMGCRPQMSAAMQAGCTALSVACSGCCTSLDIGLTAAECCMPAAGTAGCSFQGSILLMGQTTETESGASVAESEEVTGTRKSGETNSLWKLRSL